MAVCRRPAAFGWTRCDPVHTFGLQTSSVVFVVVRTKERAAVGQVPMETENQLFDAGHKTVRGGGKDSLRFHLTVKMGREIIPSI